MGVKFMFQIEDSAYGYIVTRNEQTTGVVNVSETIFTPLNPRTSLAECNRFLFNLIKRFCHFSQQYRMGSCCLTESKIHKYVVFEWLDSFPMSSLWGKVNG